MGYRTVVLDPDPPAPAGRVADVHLVAAVRRRRRRSTDLAATCAVVTTEFENPPAAALERLAADVVVAPPPAAVAIAQDRIAEKRFLADVGVPDGAVRASSTRPTPIRRRRARRSSRPPASATTARASARSATTGRARAPPGDELGGVPCVLEQRVPLDAEVSVVVARTRRRAHGRRTRSPRTTTSTASSTSPSCRPRCRRRARRPRRPGWRCAIADAPRLRRACWPSRCSSATATLLVNELAPRPHNSGHWTLDAARDEPVRAAGAGGVRAGPRATRR